MKPVFKTLCVALFLVSCQKTLTTEKDVTTAMVASDANSPLKSHTLTFTSDYPVKPGEVPPFSFTKTLYSDARVKSIRMLSRKYPIYEGFKKEAIELIGNFTYGANMDPSDKEAYPHLAFFKGTREVWEYYKSPSGTGERKSVEKSNVSYRIALTPEGWCGTVRDLILDREALGIAYKNGVPKTFDVVYVTKGGSSIGQTTALYAVLDYLGNLTAFNFPHTFVESYFNIAYDYSQPRNGKNFSFIPSQNLISQEFSLMEVMQWLPQPTHYRKTANGTFLAPTGRWTLQEQEYKNYKFDTNGNQTSLTYGDNVLQKTTWHVQP